MIEVIIRKNDVDLAIIHIKNEWVHPDGTADYSVRFGVERGSAVGLHRRNFYNFPRKKYNALALVRLALNTLQEKELELESDYDPDAPPRTSNMARRLSRKMLGF